MCGEFESLIFYDYNRHHYSKRVMYEVTNIMLHVGLGHQLCNVWHHTNLWEGPAIVNIEAHYI